MRMLLKTTRDEPNEQVRHGRHHLVVSCLELLAQVHQVGGVRGRHQSYRDGVVLALPQALGKSLTASGSELWFLLGKYQHIAFTAASVAAGSLDAVRIHPQSSRGLAGARRDGCGGSPGEASPAAGSLSSQRRYRRWLR